MVFALWFSEHTVFHHRENTRRNGVSENLHDAYEAPGLRFVEGRHAHDDHPLFAGYQHRCLLGLATHRETAAHHASAGEDLDVHVILLHLDHVTWRFGPESVTKFGSIDVFDKYGPPSHK